MHIDIPVSGGLDSTVLWYEALRDTDHRITAIHYREDYNPTFQQAQQRSLDAVNAVAAWLRSEVRDFDLVFGDVVKADINGVEYDSAEQISIKTDSVEPKAEIYWLRCRYSTHGFHATRLGVDQVWLGLNLWNGRLIKQLDRKSSLAGRDGAYAQYSTIPLVTPFDDPPRGRFSLMRSLPSALLPLIVTCHRGSPDTCAEATGRPCVLCRARLFYESVCAGVPDEKVRALDVRLRRLSDSALNPRVARYALLRDQMEWVSWLAAGGNPEE